MIRFSYMKVYRDCELTCIFAINPSFTIGILFLNFEVFEFCKHKIYKHKISSNEMSLIFHF